MKKLITILALAAAAAAMAEDTDVGAIITTGTIEDTAKVENLTGANAGKATITVNNNSGTAQAVTVYNAATVDTALSGKASTSDITALQGRATALETATNNLTSAVATAQSTAEAAGTAANAAYANATNYTASGYLPLTGGTLSGGLKWGGGSGELKYTSSSSALRLVSSPGWVDFDWTGIDFFPGQSSGFKVLWPTSAGRIALTSDITNTVPSWARAESKPSYNFSEIGSKPTTLAGYGITDASTTAQMNTAISNATNGLAKASDLSGYVPTSRKVAGMALSSDVTLKNLSIVGSSTTTYNGSATASVNQSTLTETSTTQGGTTGKSLTLAVAATSRTLGEYYIKIGTDGKPHLMLRQ